MAKVLVYRFDFSDGSGQVYQSPRAATLDRIERMDGHPLRETALEVDQEEVDSNGFLRSTANNGSRSSPTLSWHRALLR